MKCGWTDAAQYICKFEKDGECHLVVGQCVLDAIISAKQEWLTATHNSVNISRYNIGSQSEKKEI